MKKLTVILMMLILAAGMVFASNTVTLNSTVAAGTGVTPGTGNVIGGGNSDGFWLRLAYYTDKNTTAREVTATAENARLTEDNTDDSLISDLTFVISYEGNPASSGRIENIMVATEGWKGIGAENSSERFPISLTYTYQDSTVSNLGATEEVVTVSTTDDETGETTVSASFSVDYPSGLVATSKTLATIKADWAKTNNRKAGNYQATITVTVNGN